MSLLPSIKPLIQRCRALATLDLILSRDWRQRRFYFNSHWSENESMAGMRDSFGRGWWIVFHRKGWAALKGFDRDSSAWNHHGRKLALALQQSFPLELHSFATEIAFDWRQTSFAYFQLGSFPGWIRVNDLCEEFATPKTGEANLLSHLSAEPAHYISFAAAHYQVEVAEQSVARIYKNQPISGSTIRSLNRSVRLDEIQHQLTNEIQYPTRNLNKVARPRHRQESRSRFPIFASVVSHKMGSGDIS